MKTPEERLTRGKGNFINCTDYDDAVQAMKEYAIEYHEQQLMNDISVCDGCNVRPPWEHRCHGEGCNCDDPICMERQGRITHDELMDIVNRNLSNKG